MRVDWTGETVAWIVFGVSIFYLVDRLVISLITRLRRPPRRKPEK